MPVSLGEYTGEGRGFCAAGETPLVGFAVEAGARDAVGVLFEAPPAAGVDGPADVLEPAEAGVEGRLDTLDLLGAPLDDRVRALPRLVSRGAPASRVFDRLAPRG